MGLFKHSKGWILLAVSMLFYACGVPHMVTTWRVADATGHRYDKIMPVAIIKSDNDSSRIEVEEHFAEAIQNLNYNATPAYAEFGLKGLGGLDEAETYMKLCSHGIDAVLTIALLDREKEEYNKAGNLYAYPASHYYNRIWNYKNIQVNVQNGDKNTSQTGNRFWEIILYDLNTLEAACVIQTISFTDLSDSRVIDDLARQIIRRMQIEKTLPKKPASPGNRKPF